MLPALYLPPQVRPRLAVLQILVGGGEGEGGLDHEAQRGPVGELEGDVVKIRGGQQLDRFVFLPTTIGNRPPAGPDNSGLSA